jgi:UDP-glucose 4-epimerase
MRVVVTGSHGFIGSYVCLELVKHGHEVIAVDSADGCDIVTMGYHTIDRFQRADAVIHLAGVLGTSELFDDYQRAIKVNVLGAANVLQQCANNGLRYVGITMPQVWKNVYQSTKQAAVNLAEAWHANKGVPVCHVRAFNAFGVGQKVGTPQKIIPTFSDCAYKERPMPIWGDGEQLVDLVYVGDIARVLVDALGFGNLEIFDAGTGVVRTVNEVARMVAHVATPDTDPLVDHLPMRSGESGRGVWATGEGWDSLKYHPRFNFETFERTVLSYKSAEVPVIR